MKYLFVFNPKAKRYNPAAEVAIVTQAADILQSPDIVVAYTVPQPEGPTLRYGIEILDRHGQDVDCVVAVGGDGTVNIAASALMRYGLASRVPLGVIPYGTGNNLVRSFKLQRNSVRALQTIRRMHTVNLDIGVINRQYYFVNTSFGLFAYLVPRRVTKSLAGWIYDGLRHIRFVPSVARIRYVDAAGRMVELPPQCYMVGALLNTSYYGSILHMAPDAVGDDGLFDVKLIRAGPWRDYPLMMTIILTGRYQLSPRTMTFRARQLEVLSDTPCPFETDGDAIPLQPDYRVEIAGRIKLIVPRQKAVSAASL